MSHPITRVRECIWKVWADLVGFNFATSSFNNGHDMISLNPATIKPAKYSRLSNPARSC